MLAIIAGTQCNPRYSFASIRVLWLKHVASSDNYQKVVLELAGVNPIRVVDWAVPLHDTNTACTSTVQVAHRVKTDISKTLHNSRQTAISQHQSVCPSITPGYIPIRFLHRSYYGAWSWQALNSIKLAYSTSWPNSQLRSLTVSTFNWVGQ